MMGYVFLAISLLAGATKGYCGKKTSGYVTGYTSALTANTIRMVLCTFIGAVMIIAGENIRQFKVTPEILAVSALSGVSTSIFVICWLLSVKNGAYMMLDVFLMLGVIIPILGGKFFFNEPVAINQWIGVIILLVAAIIMCSYNNSIKGKMSISAAVLLLVCGVANGITDFSQKLFVKELSHISVSIFNFYTYLISAVVMGILLLILKTGKESEKNTEIFCLNKVFGYIVVMSICLFANSYFKTKAAEYFDSAQLYPLNQGLALVLSSIMSAVLFRERLTPKCIIGIVLSFIGLIIINVITIA